VIVSVVFDNSMACGLISLAEEYPSDRPQGRGTEEQTYVREGLNFSARELDGIGYILVGSERS